MLVDQWIFVYPFSEFHMTGLVWILGLTNKAWLAALPSSNGLLCGSIDEMPPSRSIHRSSQALPSAQQFVEGQTTLLDRSGMSLPDPHSQQGRAGHGIQLTAHTSPEWSRVLPVAECSSLAGSSLAESCTSYIMTFIPRKPVIPSRFISLKTHFLILAGRWFYQIWLERSAIDHIW